MGKTGNWLRSFLRGKKEKENQNSSVATENPTTPILILQTTPREKKRWSFRRSSATAAAAPKDLNSAEPAVSAKLEMQDSVDNEDEDEQKKHVMAVVAATAAAADAAAAAAQAAAVVIRLTAAATGRASATEEASASAATKISVASAARKIQSVFRGYLARKALCALKGLVKLQALVRGHLVRKQATATLRCMQALITVQARARAQRLQMTEDTKPSNARQSINRDSTQENRFRHQYYYSDRAMEENIKIVEMDHYSAYPKQDHYLQVSPAPSALTDVSPRACSGHFEDCSSFCTAQSSPQYCSAAAASKPVLGSDIYEESLSYECQLCPSYMANTESSRAKVRSQSAPKTRPPDSFERQPSRRRASMEGRNIPRAMPMQRSSSHVGATAQNYQYPWSSIKLDRSTVSLKESECGSTSTVLTNTNYCRSFVSTNK